jgi:hypothetical protein
VIGRDDQVESIAGALREPSRFVVTLTGPGGVGKTTLALLVAVAAREQFPAGTALVELADVRSAEEVVPAIATALGVPDSGAADRLRAIASFVGNRRLLLVLDNIEHVLPCAPAVATPPEATSDAHARWRGRHGFLGGARTTDGISAPARIFPLAAAEGLPERHGAVSAASPPEGESQLAPGVFGEGPAASQRR